MLMRSIKTIIDKIDPVLLTSALILNIIAIIIFLILQQTTGGFSYFEHTATKFITALIIGITLYFVLINIPTSWLLNPKVILAGWSTNLLLLITVLFLPPIANVKRWIPFPFFYLQPSELYKILTVLLTGLFIHDKRTIILWAIGIILIFLQPDLGTTILLIITFTTTIITSIAITNPFLNNVVAAFLTLLTIFILANVSLFIGTATAILAALYLLERIPIKHALLGVLLFLGILTFLYNLPFFLSKLPLKEYQKQRLEPVIKALNNKRILILSDISIKNFHTRQAQIAIGSGGILGKGVSNLTQSRLRFLPEAESDFIYATISEGFGLVGALLVILLYTVLISRFLYITYLNINTPYYFTISLGFTILLMIEILIPLGVNLALLPTKGMPFPFLSYGGTSLITHYVILSIQTRILKETKKQA